MKKISRLLAALPSLALPLFLAVLLPILMTGTAAAQTLRITNGTSSNFSSGTFDYGGVYVGFTNGVLDSNNLTVVNTNTLLNILFPVIVGTSGASNSLEAIPKPSLLAWGLLSYGHAYTQQNSARCSGNVGSRSHRQPERWQTSDR